MPILGADGRPAGAKPQQQASVIGFVILRQDAGHLSPVENDQGTMVIFTDPQTAAKHAQVLADAELRPSKDQKVVTPQMKSRVYFVVALAPVAQIQANIKNPAQLLAPEGQKPN